MGRGEGEGERRGKGVIPVCTKLLLWKIIITIKILKTKINYRKI